MCQMYEFLAIESGIDLLSEVSELLVVSLELFVDSLRVEFVVFGIVVAEVLDTGERSGESLGSGLHVVGEGAEIIDLPSEEFLVRAEIIGFGRVLEVLVVEAASFPFVYVLDVAVVRRKSLLTRLRARVSFTRSAAAASAKSAALAMMLAARSPAMLTQTDPSPL